MNLIALLLASALGGQAPASDEAGVREALNHYIAGHATGDGNHFREAFYPDAKLWFVRDGKLTSISSQEFAAGASGKPAADEAQRRRSIETIDIAGDAATARIVLDYPAVRFTDYMTLLKVDGKWRIINKSFYAERRPKPSG